MRTILSGLGLLSATLLFTACEDSHPRGGGGTVQPNQSFTGLYVANPDHGTITRFEAKSGAWHRVQVGQEPSRIARAGNRVFVTNRAERSVTVLEDDGTALRVIGRIQTGAEPFGIVSTEDRVYISASASGQVVEYDASTFAELRKWNMTGEPGGIALHPDGRTLIAAQTYGGQYAHIDLDDGALTMHDLPVHFGFDFDKGLEVELARRITGDPAFSPDGATLAIPVLYVNNTSPIFDPNDDTGGSGDRRGPGGGYQDRMNPGIVVTPVDGSGQPIPEDAVAVTVNSFVVEETNGIAEGRSVSSFPVSVSFTANGEIAFVALQGADAVVALDLAEMHSANRAAAGASAPSDAEPGFGFPGGSSFQFVPSVAIKTNAGPVGIAVLNDNAAFVHALFDNTLQRIDIDEVVAALRPENANGIGLAIPEEAPGRSPEQIVAKDARIIESNVLSAEVDRGRRLFFSTSNRSMAADGAGVSCATCHFNGRTDGLSWTFDRGQRQTPSLAGNVSLTEPVGWTGDRPTVAEDAMQTSQGLMGGEGLLRTDADDIQAFVNSTRHVDNPFKDENVDAINRGRAIFERPDVACASCHNGPAFTDNRVVAMFELPEAKVRSLVGVAMTAPYFHDGSAPTLKDVLLRARDGSMGNTSSLSDAQLDDLVIYLKSL